jgi:hypothetical protein
MTKCQTKSRRKKDMNALALPWSKKTKIYVLLFIISHPPTGWETGWWRDPFGGNI